MATPDMQDDPPGGPGMFIFVICPPMQPDAEVGGLAGIAPARGARPSRQLYGIRPPPHGKAHARRPPPLTGCKQLATARHPDAVSLRGLGMARPCPERPKKPVTKV